VMSTADAGAPVELVSHTLFDGFLATTLRSSTNSKLAAARSSPTMSGRDFDATPGTSLLTPQSRPFLAHQVWGARLRWAARADEEPTATKGGDPSGIYKRWFGRVSGRDGW
jgi:hypothetical protein